ncbi:mini-circle protein [Gracilaria domingensis]|nr:mini-circle protein [Gracilaria domingensis]
MGGRQAARRICGGAAADCRADKVVRVRGRRARRAAVRGGAGVAARRGGRAGRGARARRDERRRRARAVVPARAVAQRAAVRAAAVPRQGARRRVRGGGGKALAHPRGRRGRRAARRQRAVALVKDDGGGAIRVHVPVFRTKKSTPARHGPCWPFTPTVQRFLLLYFGRPAWGAPLRREPRFTAMGNAIPRVPVQTQTVHATSRLCSASDRARKSKRRIIHTSPQATHIVSHQHSQHGEQLLRESLQTMLHLEGAAEGKTSKLDAIQHIQLYALDSASWSNISRGLSVLISTDDSLVDVHRKCNTPCETVLNRREWLTYYVAVSYSHLENNFAQHLSQRITNVIHDTVNAAVGSSCRYRIWSDRLLAMNKNTTPTNGQRIRWARIGLLPYLAFPTINVTFDRHAALERYWIATELLCAITTGGLLIRHGDDNGSLVSEGKSGLQFISMTNAHLVTKGGMASGIGELALRLLSGANMDKVITFEEDRAEVLEWAREVAVVCTCQRMVTLSRSLSSDSNKGALKHSEIATALVYISMSAYKSSCSRYISESRKILSKANSKSGWDGLGEWLSMQDIDRTQLDIELEDQWKKGITWIIMKSPCGKKLAVGERRKRENDNMGSAMIVKLSPESDLSGRGTVEASLALHGSECEMILSAFAKLYGEAFGMCPRRCSCNECENSRQTERGLPSEIVSGYHDGECVRREVDVRISEQFLETLGSVEECRAWIPYKCLEFVFVSDCDIYWG